MNDQLKKYAHLKLSVHSKALKYVLLDDVAELSSILLASKSSSDICFAFISRGEVSAILPEETLVLKSKREEPGWNAIYIIGEMPFGTVQGLIATITSALKASGLGACVVSTYLTDYFLVKISNLEKAKAALIADGWEFSP